MASNGSSIKVLHVVEHGITLNSGYGFRSMNIFRAQRERGWQPVVLTFPKANESGKGNWKHPETVVGIKCYYRPLPKGGDRLPGLAKLRWKNVLVRRIHEVIRLEKPDLLHAHSPVANGVAALKVGRELGIPVVYEIRSLWEEASVANGVYGYHSRRFKRLRTLETWACRNADRVVVISNSLKNHLASRGIPLDKISVVTNGVDLDKIKSAAPDPEYKENWKLTRKEVIGYVGSFRSYEGLELLVRAIARLSKTRPDVRLLLVGGGRAEVELELKALVDKLDLGQWVIMPGWIPQDRIPGVYALIDILVYPRRRLPLTDLITPLKPLEAMATGKALIASDVGGHQELIQPGYNGLLFPSSSESALAQAIADLLDNPALQHRLALQGAAWVRRERSWAKTTSVYGEVYQKVRRDQIGTRLTKNGPNVDLAVVCNSLRRGGVSRTVCTLCNAWSRLGYNVSLITLKNDDSFFRLESSIRRIDAGVFNATGSARRCLTTIAAKILAIQKRLFLLPRSNKLSLLEASPWLLPRVGPLRAAIRQTRSSVVVSFGSVANILTILACRNLGAKIVISERNDVGRRLLNRPWEQLRSRFYNRADLVTANTAGALAAMQTYVSKEKLTLIPNPIASDEPVADASPAVPIEPPFVLVVANLNRLKAHDVLLEAFARLSPNLSHWRLAIVGDGELEKSLRDQAETLEIGNRVDWRGLVADPFPFYRAASIFALPSRSEGMPNALMEAMSCGLPVIVSNASPGPLGLVEDGKTGLVVPVEDSSALAKAIELLANDAALRKRLGDAARRRVSEYDLSNVLGIWKPIISAGPETCPGAGCVPHNSSARTAGTA